MESVDLTLRPGEVVGLLGPNGCGKSTLLRTLSGVQKPESGSITLGGRALAAWSFGDLARKRAVLSQSLHLEFPFTVREVVEMGRPWAGSGSKRVVELALSLAGICHLVEREYATLSGGEKQRVQFARAVHQIWDDDGRSRYLLLDEPTSHLDLAHQHSILETARFLAARGCAVLVVLHDLNLAARYADRLALMRSGRLHTCGTVREVLTPERIQACLDVEARVLREPDGIIQVLTRPLEERQHDSHEGPPSTRDPEDVGTNAEGRQASAVS